MVTLEGPNDKEVEPSKELIPVIKPSILSVPNLRSFDFIWIKTFSPLPKKPHLTISSPVKPDTFSSRLISSSF